MDEAEYCDRLGIVSQGRLAAVDTPAALRARVRTRRSARTDAGRRLHRPGADAVTASLMRLRGLMRKEIKQVLRDPSAILIAFLMPIVLLVTNGFGISLDASEMKLAVVIEAPEETARGMLQALDASPYLSVQRALSTRDGETAMIEGRVRGMLVLRDDFSQRAGRPGSWPAPAQLVVNATDPNTARILEGYVSGALQVWLAGQARRRRLAPMGGIDLEYRDWFNPELRSADFIVPGIIAMVMTMAGTLLTAAACRASGNTARWKACSPRRRAWSN